MTAINSNSTGIAERRIQCLSNSSLLSNVNCDCECKAGTSDENVEKKLNKQCYEISNNSQFLQSKNYKLICGSSRNAFGLLKEKDDFELLEKLGEGFFGVVYKVREKTSNDVMVIKIPIMHNHASRLNAKKIVIKEDYMLRFLEHPNILKSRGICVERLASTWHLNLLVDFCNKGSLQQLILSKQKPFPWLQRCKIALDVCRAMTYVHSQGFVHRDLTSMNILLKSQNFSQYPIAVVADFGLSTLIPQYPKILQQVGTQNWMAPEMLKEKFYNEKSDIFSFGIILCQMISRIDADHDAGLYRTPVFGLDYVRFIARCPSETPLPLLRIAFSCCVFNANSRPSFKSLFDQFKELVRQKIDQEIFPKEKASLLQEIKLGRSRSDAAIRSNSNSYISKTLILHECVLQKNQGVENDETKILSNSTKHKRKKFSEKFDDMKDEMRSSKTTSIIHEGKTTEVFTSNNFAKNNLHESSQNKLDEENSSKFRELAASVASNDPDYEESEGNPFSTHFRYRSIRKIKPTNLPFNLSSLQNSLKSDKNSLISTECFENDTFENDKRNNKFFAEDEYVINQPYIKFTKDRTRSAKKFRSISLPSFFTFPESNNQSSLNNSINKTFHCIDSSFDNSEIFSKHGEKLIFDPEFGSFLSSSLEKKAITLSFLNKQKDF